MQFVATFIVLAVGGVIDTANLMYRHAMKAKRPVICPLKGDCNAVTEGEWSTTFGVRNDLLGLLYYLAALAGILVSLFMPGVRSTIYLLLIVMTGGGLVFSAYLVYLQAKVIRQYCFYCLLSALINLLMFINATALS